MKAADLKYRKMFLLGGSLAVFALVITLWSPYSVYWSTISSKSLLRALDPSSYQPEVGDLPLVCITKPESDQSKQEGIRSALKIYVSAVERAPINATSHRLAGQAYCLLGDYHNAINSFQKAHLSNRADVISSSELLSLYTRLGDWDAFQQLLDEHTITAYDMAQAAKTLIYTDQLSSAMIWCRSAFKIDPDEKEVWLTWLLAGWAYEKKQDWVSATQLYSSALSEQDRLNIRIYQGSFYYRLGWSIYNQNDQDNSQSVLDPYNRAIERGDFSNVWDQASAYIQRGNWYRANYGPAQSSLYLHDYETAFQVNPNSATAAQLIGETYLKDFHELDQAERYFRLAIAISPKTPYFYVLLGDTLTQKGDLQGAVEAYQQAFVFKPDWTFLPERIEVLQAKINGNPLP